MLITTPRLFKRIYSRISKRLQNSSVEGLPQGLTFAKINELCLQHWDDHLLKVSYVHLSSWKAAGSYRLILKTKKGKTKRLVYKNAIYNSDHIPALKGLPVIPGFPEYLVYKNVYQNPQEAIGKYLPNVYLVKEIIPQKHYQYFLEDLGNEYYTTAYQPKVSLNVSQKISALHRAMNGFLPEAEQNRLLRYDGNFSLAIQEYFRRNIESYLQKTDNQTINEIYKLWSQISELHARQEFQELQTNQPIHGDLNVSNILIHKKYPDRVKFIDWEWAGLGKVHADLASLFTRSKPEIEYQALVIFATQNKQLPFEQHRRLYHWCQLERGLLDAAFIAVQQLQSSHQSDFLSSPEFIESAMQRIFKSYQELV